MAADKITELVDQQAFDQLTKLVEQLGVTQENLVKATAQAAQFTAALGGATATTFTENVNGANASLDKLAITNQKFVETQQAVILQTEAVVASTKAKIIAVNEDNAQIDAVVRKYAQLKIELASVAAQLKQATEYSGMNARALSQLGLDTDALTKKQALLKAEFQSTGLALRTLAAEQQQVRATTTAVLSPYQALSKELDQARLRAKDLAVVFGVESEQAIKAAEGVAILHGQLLQVDQSVGQSQRNVGNYASALTGATEKQGAFGAAISRVTNLSNLGAMAVQVFTRMMLRMVAFGLIFEGVSKLWEWIKGLDVFTGRLNQAVQNLAALNDVMKEASQTAGENIGKLRILSDATQDLTLSEKERLAAANEMKKLWPDQLSNASAQSIANGDEAASINKITEALLAEAKAEAVVSKIKKLAGEEVELQFQRDKVNAKKSEDLDRLNTGAGLAEAGVTTAITTGTAQAGGVQQSAQEVKNETIKKIKSDADVANMDIANQIAIKEKQIKFLEQFGGVGKEAKAIEDADKKKTKTDNTYNTDQLDYERAVLERAKQREKGILDNENKSYTERLEALRNFIAIEKKIVENERETSQANPDLTKTQRRTINVQAGTKGIAVDAEGVAQQQRLQKELGESIKKAQEELLRSENAKEKQHLDDFINSQNEQVNTIDDEKAKSLSILADKYAQGLIKKKAYEDRLYAIDAEAKGRTLQLQLDTLKKTADTQAAALALGFGKPEDLQKTGEAITKTQTSITNLGTANTLHNALQENPDDMKSKLYAAEIKAGDDLLDATKTVYDGIVKAEESRIAKQMRLMEIGYNAEKHQAEAGVGTARDRSNRILQIDAEEAAQKAVLQEKENQIKRKAAIADKIYNTAKAIEGVAVAEANATVYLSNPLTAAFYPALAAIIAATGAIQIAAIAATPLPSYEKGTSFAKGGTSLVGEKGHELIIDPSGRSFMSPDNPSLIDLKRGSKVFTHNETMRFLAQPERVVYVGGQQIDNKDVILALKEVNQSIKSTQQQISRKPGIQVNSSWKTYLQRNGIN
jgi:hypothetical protein